MKQNGHFACRNVKSTSPWSRRAQSGRFLMMFLLLSAFCLLPSVSSAQQHPKIGLVLSGGGAKGFAHIGVLKVIDSLGIKVDYIGGTSMGAVIGGLYASGYSAAQIDSVFQSTDFDELLRDYIPRSSKNFFEKRNDEMYAISLPFNKFRLGIPTALSKGTYNYNLLANLAHKVRHVRDFSKLPVPFFCVATDIETGEEVVLDKGYLVQAIQASSAFPSLFSPVEIGGRVLVDGGVVNNYPVEEIRRRGAEIVIGIDVQDDLKPREALKDATRILVQISNMDMIAKMKEKRRMTDVYIKPDITDFSVVSFSDGQAIIDRGQKAARQNVAELAKLATPGFAWKRDGLTGCDSLDIKRIITPRLDNYTRSYIIGKLRFKPSSRISYDDLKAGINNLNASQNFSAMSFSLEENEGGDDLKLNLTENKTKAYLKFGLHYDGLYKSAILTNVTYKNALIKNDVASLDLMLGDNLRYNFDYYIDNGFYLSFGFRSKLTGFNRNIGTDFNGGELLDALGIDSFNVDFTDWTNQVYFQTLFVQKYLIGGGLEHKYLKIESETLESTSPVFEKSSYLSAFGYFKYDSMDDKYFPQRGWLFSGDFQSYLYSTDYTSRFEPFSIAKANLSFARKIFRKTTVRFDAEAGCQLGERTVDFFNFVLGGYGFTEVNNVKPFYGYNFLTLTGDTFIRTGIIADYEFYRKNHLNFAANYAQIGDRLFDDTEWVSKPQFSGYALGYGLETVVGPIEIKYSWSPDTRKDFFWFSVGFWF